MQGHPPSAALVAGAATLPLLLAAWLCAASLIFWQALLLLEPVHYAALAYSPWMWWEATRYWSQSSLFRQLLLVSGGVPALLIVGVAVRLALMGRRSFGQALYGTTRFATRQGRQAGRADLQRRAARRHHHSGKDARGPRHGPALCRPAGYRACPARGENAVRKGRQFRDAERVFLVGVAGRARREARELGRHGGPSAAHGPGGVSCFSRWPRTGGPIAGTRSAISTPRSRITSRSSSAARTIFFPK